jgi:hypothetical protein
MQKKVISLFSALSVAALGYTVDNPDRKYPYSNQQYDSKGRTSDSKLDITQNESIRSSPSRWYKSRAGRQEYLKGGSDYPRDQNQYSSEEYQEKQTAPRSDPRWYKSRAGRQEYLKGGGDYPGR